jgi:Putative Flp pilus-assembly TadE/G-like
MNLNAKSVLASVIKRQEGQILPWVAFMMISFAGISAFVVDIGRGIIAYHMLQASCDAAAMAGVQLMGSDFTQTSTAIANQATLYSSVSGNRNANPTLLPGAAMVSGYPHVYCSAVGTANQVPCVGAANTSNAITVSQTVQLPTIFGGIIGVPHLTVGATSSALMAGNAAQKYNIAVVIDTTQSMTSSDPGGCTGGTTKIGCALTGFQTLLAGLTPCAAGSSGTCTGFDSVAVFTYPEIPASQATDDTSCPSSTPSPVPYTAPTAITSTSIATTMSTTYALPTGSSASYAITTNTLSGGGTSGTNGFLSNWSTNNQPIGSSPSNYNSGSGVAAAAGAGSGCTGMKAKGGEGTYFAGAIYAAGAALAAQGAAVPNSKNALIILSDGDASSSSSQFASSLTLNNSGANKGTYPSSIDECHQAITAAQNVSTYVPNTTVFTIAYNASNSASSTCSTDTTGGEAISACSTMQQMATTTADAYADKSSTCSGPTFTLPAIFGAIRTHLTNPRLLNPNS